MTSDTSEVDSLLWSLHQEVLLQLERDLNDGCYRSGFEILKHVPPQILLSVLESNKREIFQHSLLQEEEQLDLF